MILSGMSSLEQLEENIRIFAEEKPLTEKERETWLDIVDRMVKKIVLPGTAAIIASAIVRRD